jgi:hypothetical protein
MDRYRSKLMHFLLSVTFTGLENTLAYYRIRKLQIRNVFIVQAPGVPYCESDFGISSEPF